MSERATRLWLERFVIDLTLCPFARAPYLEGRVRIVTLEQTDEAAALQGVIKELDALLEATPERLSTTLCVTPRCFVRFEDFLEACEALEAMLEESGASALAQLAHFHPLYRFEGEPEDDPSHFTNRSPYPVFHWLRLEEVSQAIDATSKVEQIPARNVRLMRQLGAPALKRRLSALRHDAE